MSLRIQPPSGAPPDSGQSNVIAFAPRKRQEPAEPLLTEDECIELRQMLQEFKAIKGRCPMAKAIIDDTGE